MNERKIVMSNEEIVIAVLLMVIVSLILYIVPTILRIQFLESALERIHKDFSEYLTLTSELKNVKDANNFQSDFNEKWNKVCENMKEFGNHV